jgi:hypothetical protein
MEDDLINANCCRICLGSVGYISVFDKLNDDVIADQIYFATGVKVSSLQAKIKWDLARLLSIFHIFQRN